MLCLLQNTQTNATIVVGNAHFEHSPMLDHVKYGEAIYYVERAAQYIRENSVGRDSLPFISGGDFNAQPKSSALSAFYNENIFEESGEASPSTWKV